jgi:hypothetical protein
MLATWTPTLLQEIAAARRHVARLEQAAAKLAAPQAETDPQTNWLDGGEQIAKFLNWPVKRVYAVHRAGKFKGAVWKVGWRSLIGSRSRLRALPETLTTKT